MFAGKIEMFDTMRISCLGSKYKIQPVSSAAAYYLGLGILMFLRCQNMARLTLYPTRSHFGQ